MSNTTLNFALFWLFAVVLSGAGVYSLFMLKKLPWQKPLFDRIDPGVPESVGKKGILIFSKTNGFRHGSIEPGIQAIKKVGAEKGWDVRATENGAIFKKNYLDLFKVVIFLSTTSDVLTADQKRDFEAFVENGGGYVGIHSASDTEHDWGWYDSLLGTHFKSHTLIPKHLAQAMLITEERNHPATRHLPSYWNKVDEWYNFKKNIRGKKNIEVLLSINEGSYLSVWPKGMGEDHPISWTSKMAKGRMFYTGMGHTADTFSDSNSLLHIIGGIQWAGKL